MKQHKEFYDLKTKSKLEIYTYGIKMRYKGIDKKKRKEELLKIIDENEKILRVDFNDINFD